MRKGKAIISFVFTPKATILLIVFFLSYSASSQTKIDSLLNKLDRQKLAASITNKADKLEEKLVAKSIPVKTKFFKKTSVKLLWFFLSLPTNTRNIACHIFRVGHNF